MRFTKRSRKNLFDNHCTELIQSVEDNGYWKVFNNYLDKSRININVRQVFEPGKGPRDYQWPTSDPYQHTS